MSTTEMWKKEKQKKMLCTLGSGAVISPRSTPAILSAKKKSYNKFIILGVKLTCCFFSLCSSDSHSTPILTQRNNETLYSSWHVHPYNLGAWYSLPWMWLFREDKMYATK